MPIKDVTWGLVFVKDRPDPLLQVLAGMGGV